MKRAPLPKMIGFGAVLLIQVLLINSTCKADPLGTFLFDSGGTLNRRASGELSIHVSSGLGFTGSQPG